MEVEFNFNTIHMQIAFVTQNFYLIYLITTLLNWHGSKKRFGIYLFLEKKKILFRSIDKYLVAVGFAFEFFKKWKWDCCVDLDFGSLFNNERW